MSEPYKVIFEFLRESDPEVSGRSAVPVPPEVRARMHRFASGELGAAEQQELQQVLEGQPEWISALAQEVKALRPPDED